MGRKRLSQRQKERIQAIQARRRENLAGRAERMLADYSQEIPREGRVVVRYGQNLAVRDRAGRLHHCLIRRNIGQAVCGDRVVWQVTGEDEGVVTALLERDSALVRPNYSGQERPLAANITRIVVVLAPLPEPSPYLLDQYLVTAETIGVPALIAVNKSDLLTGEAGAAFERDFGHYATIGYPVVRISARFEHGLDPLTARLAGETSILVGQSGVGKSSLVNALLPDIEAQTGRLSDTGLGRHTTSATTLYNLPCGGFLIDSPGVRSFRLTTLTLVQLESGFREFRPFLGRCRFSNCAHGEEPGCALAAAVAAGAVHPRRLANFRHLAAGLSR